MAQEDRYEPMDSALIGRLGPLIRREPKGLALLRNGLSHQGQYVCPGADCGLDVSGVGITVLAYVYAVCDCPAWAYSHLVEQLWHRDCLVDS